MLRFREKPGDIFELAQNADRTGTIVIPVFPYVTRFSGVEVFGASLARDFICRFSEEEQSSSKVL